MKPANSSLKLTEKTLIADFFPFKHTPAPFTKQGRRHCPAFHTSPSGKTDKPVCALATFLLDMSAAPALSLQTTSKPCYTLPNLFPAICFCRALIPAGQTPFPSLSPSAAPRFQQGKRRCFKCSRFRQICARPFIFCSGLSRSRAFRLCSCSKRDRQHCPCVLAAPFPSGRASFPVPAAAQLQRNNQSHSVTLPPPWFGRASAVFRPVLRTGSS